MRVLKRDRAGELLTAIVEQIRVVETHMNFCALVRTHWLRCCFQNGLIVDCCEQLYKYQRREISRRGLSVGGSRTKSESRKQRPTSPYR